MRWLRSLDPQLPREVWLLQLGGVMNSFGNGLVLPFLVIYLHDVRGFGLGVSGLVVAVSAAAQLTAGLVAGPLVDRFGPRTVLGAGLVMQSVGFGLFPLVRSPWHAFALIAIEGAGSAGFWPSQSTLIARLTPPARRHAAYAQQRVTMNLGIGLGGLSGGLIASVAHPSTFTVLFLVDAATFLAYVGVLGLVHDPGIAEEERAETAASYRPVLRDRLFVRLWGLNFLFVTAGYSLFNLVPPFARDHAHLSERQIGAVFFVNTGLIVVVQLPISRAIEGHRRLRALALMPLLWVGAWLLVDAGGYWLDGSAAFVVIMIALAVFGVGECFHGPAHQALVAEIAPDHLRGRYFAVHSLSWGLAGTVGPAVGGFLLASAPFTLWPAAAATCVLAALGSLRTEPLVPERYRRIPRTEPAPPVIDIAPAS
ncbi:MAG TPA: MFS transporter [Gaiellaceae bacterium]|nr:MFS transporter [Thermoleophilia bacterium]HWJ32879.1 MFS transporter [Gaiellaceae bacterium]